MLESLSSLEDGEAWIWSPHLMKEFKRFKFNLSSTFDSGATPKGKRGRPVATLRDVDVGKLKGRIQETIEKAAQENPALLRHQISTLKAHVHAQQVQIEKLQKLKIPVVKKTNIKMKMPDFNKAMQAIEKLRTVTVTVEATITKINNAVISNDQQIRALVLHESRQEKGKGVDALLPPKKSPFQAGKSMKDLLDESVAKKRGTQTTHNSEPHVVSEGVKLTATPRAQLAVLAAVYPKKVSLTYLSLMAKYSIKSSGFTNGLSALRTAGLAEGKGKTIAATAQGVRYNGPAEPLPEGKDLLEFWKSKVTACPACLLEVLYNVYPRELTKEELAAASATYSRDGNAYSLTSSGFSNGLSLLRSLELIKGYDKMKASPELFGEVEHGEG